MDRGGLTYHHRPLGLLRRELREVLCLRDLEALVRESAHRGEEQLEFYSQ